MSCSSARRVITNAYRPHAPPVSYSGASGVSNPDLHVVGMTGYGECATLGRSGQVWWAGVAPGPKKRGEHPEMVPLTRTFPSPPAPFPRGRQARRKQRPAFSLILMSGELAPTAFRPLKPKLSSDGPAPRPRSLSPLAGCQRPGTAAPSRDGSGPAFEWIAGRSCLSRHFPKATVRNIHPLGVMGIRRTAKARPSRSLNRVRELLIERADTVAPSFEVCAAFQGPPAASANPGKGDPEQALAQSFALALHHTPGSSRQGVRCAYSRYPSSSFSNV